MPRVLQKYQQFKPCQKLIPHWRFDRSWPSWGGWDGGIDSADNIHGTHNSYAVCLVCKCLPCSRSRSTEPEKRMVSRFYSVWSLGWSKLMTSFHCSAYQRQLLPGTRVSLDCWAHSVWRLRIELVHVLGCCLLCFLHFQRDGRMWNRQHWRLCKSRVLLISSGDIVWRQVL